MYRTTAWELSRLRFGLVFPHPQLPKLLLQEVGATSERLPKRS
jgi:hypothetical protein